MTWLFKAIENPPKFFERVSKNYSLMSRDRIFQTINKALGSGLITVILSELVSLIVNESNPKTSLVLGCVVTVCNFIYDIYRYNYYTKLKDDLERAKIIFGEQRGV